MWGRAQALTSHSRLTYMQRQERGRAGCCGQAEILKFITWPQNQFLFFFLIFFFLQRASVPAQGTT